ncbi:MAG: neutral/alkaline non-lysosomal ceramidase N-terminal domain-containing protein [Planctomycetes bacterium]|nr:neutral/alkaline non-lysosomal ceramidase N-terminal domain-containing protein [Planctomycetota bacterium]
MSSFAWIVAGAFLWAAGAAEAAGAGQAGGAGDLKVGIAVRDVTPDGPVWLSGYSARNKASERVDQKLLVSAAAFDAAGQDRFVLLALDNCEVSREFNAPVLAEIERRHSLAPGAVIVVSSHTHSGPCLARTLPAMFAFDGIEKERVDKYSEKLGAALVEVVGAAIEDLKPARLEAGKGTAGFAMNRRVYRDDRVDFGENPVGPVDRDVPVLKVSSPEGEARAVLFGYACHGTSIAGDDFYVVSGDYMAYAREHIEAAFPGTKALYLTGCGADSNPSPRGRLIHAKQHGLELAGAVAGVLSRPMRPVQGRFRRAFARIDLPLAPPPSREKLAADAQDQNPYVARRARAWLALLDGSKPLPSSVSFPMSVIRFGSHGSDLADLTFFFLAGETVVDYALRLKQEHALESPWTVGYAFEVPCYIPSVRILKEGGYEADSSLIYYGIYGPFLGRTESMIIEKAREMVRGLKEP